MLQRIASKVSSLRAMPAAVLDSKDKAPVLWSPSSSSIFKHEVLPGRARAAVLHSASLSSKCAFDVNAFDSALRHLPFAVVGWRCDSSQRILSVH